MISWKYFIGFGIILYLRTGFCFKCYVRTNDICGKSIDLKSVESKDCRATCVLLKFKMHDAECTYRDCLNYGRESCKHYVEKMQRYFGNSFEAKQCKQCYLDGCNGFEDETIRPGGNSDNSSSYSFSIVSLINGTFNATEPNENSIDYNNNNQNVPTPSFVNKNQDSNTSILNLKTTEAMSNEISVINTTVNSQLTSSVDTSMPSSQDNSAKEATKTTQENNANDILKDNFSNINMITTDTQQVKESTSETTKDSTSSTNNEEKNTINKIDKRETHMTESDRKETTEMEQKTNSDLKSTMEYSTKEISTIATTSKQVTESKLITVPSEISNSNDDVILSKISTRQAETSMDYNEHLIGSSKSENKNTGATISTMVDYKIEFSTDDKSISDNSHISIYTTPKNNDASPKNLISIEATIFSRNDMNDISDKTSETSTISMIDKRIKNDNADISEIYPQKSTGKDIEMTQVTIKKNIITDMNSADVTKPLSILKENANSDSSIKSEITVPITSSLNLDTTEKSLSFHQSDSTSLSPLDKKQESVPIDQSNSPKEISTLQYTTDTSKKMNSILFTDRIYTTDSSQNTQTEPNYTSVNINQKNSESSTDPNKNNSSSFAITNKSVMSTVQGLETSFNSELNRQTVSDFINLGKDVISSTGTNSPNVDRLESAVTEKISSYFTKDTSSITEQLRVNLLENNLVNNMTHTLYNISLNDESQFKNTNNHRIDTRATSSDDITAEETVGTLSSMMVTLNKYYTENATQQNLIENSTSNSLLHNYTSSEVNSNDGSNEKNNSTEKTSKKIDSSIITPKIVNNTSFDSNDTKLLKAATGSTVFTQTATEYNLRDSTTAQTVFTSKPTIVIKMKSSMNGTGNQQYLTENPTKAFLNTESQRSTSSQLQIYNLFSYFSMIFLILHEL